MKLCVIGAGYVGLVSGACLADAGNDVICVDKNEEKIRRLKDGKIPIYEPGLEEIVAQNEREGRLSYTTNLEDGLHDAQICFITVDTPPSGDGRADLTNVLAVAKSIGEILDHYAIIVTKSTVPVGTTMKVKASIASGLKARGLDPEKLFDVASNPEFLKEGDAVNDFMKPDRVVVGIEKERVGNILHEIYRPFIMRQDRFVCMDIQSSELTKYAANAMLATRISFINDISRLCEKVGADISHVRNGISSDSRIGSSFLYAGLGYGGSCFPKDTKAIVELGKEYGVRLSIVESADRVNDEQREWFWQKIVFRFGGEKNLAKKKIGIWGIAFKANTDDVRFAPSLYIIDKFLNVGAYVVVYDPLAMNTGRQALGERSVSVNWADCSYKCIEGADALVVCTECLEFRSPDWVRVKALMKDPIVFDGRNLYQPLFMKDAGFEYHCIGR